MRVKLSSRFKDTLAVGPYLVHPDQELEVDSDNQDVWHEVFKGNLIDIDKVHSTKPIMKTGDVTPAIIIQDPSLAEPIQPVELKGSDLSNLVNASQETKAAIAQTMMENGIDPTKPVTEETKKTTRRGKKANASTNN